MTNKSWFRVDNGSCSGCISNGTDVFFETIEQAIEGIEYLHENSRRTFPYVIMETDKINDLRVARIVTWLPDCKGQPKRFRDPFEDTRGFHAAINLAALEEYMWREASIRGICFTASAGAREMFGTQHWPNATQAAYLFDAIECYLKELEKKKHDTDSSATNIPEEVR